MMTPLMKQLLLMAARFIAENLDKIEQHDSFYTIDAKHCSRLVEFIENTPIGYHKEP
jgi:hypothetical protein